MGYLYAVLFVSLIECILVTSSTIGYDNITSTDARAYFDGSYSPIETQADYDKVKFMAMISKLFGTPLEEHLGTGIVLSRYWIITLKAAVDTYLANALTITVCLGTYQINGIQRRVKEIVNDPGCTATPLVHCVSLLRICPSITADHIAPIATSLTAYRSPTKQIRIYQFAMNPDKTKFMKYYQKTSGETCECEDITGFVEASHVCLTGMIAPLGQAGTTDLKGMVMTDEETTEVVGLFVKESVADSGEVVLYIEAVRTFINSIIV